MNRLASLPRGACRHCGFALKRLPGLGRYIQYRQLANLAVPPRMELPTCVRCRRPDPQAADDPAVRAELARQYRHELQRLAGIVLERAACSTSMRRIEGLIGVSQGYLSRLRHGQGTPGEALLVLLHLLGQHPELLAEVEGFWAAPPQEGG